MDCPLFSTIFFNNPLLLFIQLFSFHTLIVQLGFIGGYNAIACCGIILFLVLRRSMLQSLGFTYSEVLPLHRWLGALIFFWSCLHTVGYILYYNAYKMLAEEFNFYDIGRSTMNIMGCVALVSFFFDSHLFICVLAQFTEYHFNIIIIC